jgi:hypothetical protein
VESGSETDSKPKDYFGKGPSLMDPLILLEAAAKAHVKMKVKLSCAEFCKSFWTASELNRMFLEETG